MSPVKERVSQNVEHSFRTRLYQARDASGVPVEGVELVEHYGDKDPIFPAAGADLSGSWIILWDRSVQKVTITTDNLIPAPTPADQSV